MNCERTFRPPSLFHGTPKQTSLSGPAQNALNVSSGAVNFGQTYNGNTQSAAGVPLRVLPPPRSGSGWRRKPTAPPERQRSPAADWKSQAKRGGHERKCRLNPAFGPIRHRRLVLMQSSRDVKCKPSSTCSVARSGFKNWDPGPRRGAGCLRSR